jgi:hypothetical protein
MERLTRYAPQVNHEKMSNFAKIAADKDKGLSRNNSLEIFKLIINDIRFVKLINTDLLENVRKRIDKDKLSILMNRFENIYLNTNEIS